MRVAVAQFLAGEDKAHNLARVGELVGRGAALGATLVIAPEAAMHGFGTPETPLAPVAEPLDGPFVSGLQKCAARPGVPIVAGMFEPVEGDTARAYNTVVAVGPDGQLVGRYREQHLFDAPGWGEAKGPGPVGGVGAKRLRPGAVPERLRCHRGEVTVGVMTCYDVRSPELARVLVDEGV